MAKPRKTEVVKVRMRPVVTSGQVDLSRVTVSDPDEIAQIRAVASGDRRVMGMADSKKLQRLVRLCRDGEATPEVRRAVEEIYRDGDRKLPRL